MGRPTIIEIDFYALLEEISRAREAQGLIEKKDADKWAEYVNQNNIRDASLEAHGKVKFTAGKPELVAIAMGSDWDGCYAYSKDDEAALKYVLAE